MTIFEISLRDIFYNCDPMAAYGGIEKKFWKLHQIIPRASDLIWTKLHVRVSTLILKQIKNYIEYFNNTIGQHENRD